MHLKGSPSPKPPEIPHLRQELLMKLQAHYCTLKSPGGSFLQPLPAPLDRSCCLGIQSVVTLLPVDVEQQDVTRSGSTSWVYLNAMLLFCSWRKAWYLWTSSFEMIFIILSFSIQNHLSSMAEFSVSWRKFCQGCIHSCAGGPLTQQWV